jgi:uncharacterized protein YvpB
MKYKVPYYEQNKRFTCGTTNLRMAFAYLGKKYSYSKTKKLSRQLKSTMTLMEGMALGAAEVGLSVKYYATDFAIDMKSDYFKEGMGKDGIKALQEFEKSKDNKIEVKKENISLNKLLKFLTKRSIPIVLINTNIFSKKEGFNGHYVTIVGYDKKAIYVHNSGTTYPFPYWPIKRDLFLKAWMSKNADKRVLIISK